MKRLLCVGIEVPNFPSVGWDAWQGANPLDYQGLLLDCRKPQQIPTGSPITQILTTLSNNGHSAYILLPETGVNGQILWIPGCILFVYAGIGQTLNVDLRDPFFANYRQVLTGHQIYIQIQSANSSLSQLIFEGITDNVSRTICARLKTIYLLHPPPKKAEQKALKLIIEHFKPDPAFLSSAPRPVWADEAASKIPGVAEIQADRSSIMTEIEKKTDNLNSVEEKLRQVSGWADLLWLEGLQLQSKVSEALNFLGIPSSTTDPSGHTADLVADESGSHFVFEVTGSSGSIGIEKGRQLLQWVSEAPDPNIAKGVLVANAFRNQPPDKRPPTPDHRIFVVELEAFARKYHLALLDTNELFRMVCLKLSGKSFEKSAIHSGLLIDGIVRFSLT